MYNDDGMGLAVLGIIGVSLTVFGVIVYVIFSFFLMKLFDKAGVQGRWRAWIPVYNMMIFVKLGDLNPWWFLITWIGGVLLSQLGIGFLLFIALAVYSALAAYRIGLKLQKEGAWVVLYVLLNIVWLGIMAFDRSRWSQAVPPAAWANSFLKDTTVWQGVPEQVAAGGVQGGYAPADHSQPPVGYQPTAGYQPPAPPAGPVPPANPSPAAQQPPTAEPPAADAPTQEPPRV